MPPWIILGFNGIKYTWLSHFFNMVVKNLSKGWVLLVSKCIRLDVVPSRSCYYFAINKFFCKPISERSYYVCKWVFMFCGLRELSIIKVSGIFWIHKNHIDTLVSRIAILVCQFHLFSVNKLPQFIPISEYINKVWSTKRSELVVRIVELKHIWKWDWCHNFCKVGYEHSFPMKVVKQPTSHKTANWIKPSYCWKVTFLVQDKVCPLLIIDFEFSYHLANAMRAFHVVGSPLYPLWPNAPKTITNDLGMVSSFIFWSSLPYLQLNSSIWE